MCDIGWYYTSLFVNTLGGITIRFLPFYSKYMTVYQPKVLVFLMVIACLTPGLVFSQQPFKVGVVLSGGGAKGYAHVGALKVLEEAGIRIDYIGGASMGAIVGGLYASGWPVAGLDSILRNTDMTTLLQDRVPRSVSPLFEKLYGEKYALSLSIRDGRLNLPIAYSDGQMVFDLLNQLTGRVAYVEDFSQLPVPFFCTGTDVATGESIIFDKGSLALAMRASGSFPGLLAPVEINHRLIADGGIVNNFPAKELKDRGVDLVIGINVEEGLLDRPDLNSIEKILTQIGSFQMNERSMKQMQYCDVLVCPEVKGFGITSFEAVDTLMKLGEKATRELWEQLTGIARRQRQAPPLERPPLALPEKPWQVDTVIIGRNSALSDAAVLRSFPARFPCELSEREFYQGITNLYGSGMCQFVDYRLKKLPGGEQALVVNPRLRPGYDRRFRMGLHYDDEYRSSLLLNATLLNLGFKNSVTSVDVILGDKFRYNFYYFVDRGVKPDFGVASRLNFNTVNFDLPDQISLPDSLAIGTLIFDFLDFSNETFTHLFSGNDYAAGLMGELKFYKFSTEQVAGNPSNELFFNEKGWYLGAAAFLKQDSRDKRYFPRRGMQTTFFARVIYPLDVISGEKAMEGNFGYNFDLHFLAVKQLAARLTAGLSLDGGVSLGEKVPPYRYYLGGNNLNLINNFKPFTGLHFAEFAATQLGSSTLYFQYRLLKNHYFILSGNVAWLKDAFDEKQHWIYSAGISYGLDTLLGPIEVTYGYSNKGDSFYFNLGYWF
jgi:NTE family protein